MSKSPICNEKCCLFGAGKRKRQVAKPDPKKKTKCDEKNADVEKKKPIKKPRKPKTEAPAKKNVKKSLFPKRKRTKATESSSESDVDGDLKYVSESDSEFSDDSEKCLYCDGIVTFSIFYSRILCMVR